MNMMNGRPCIGAPRVRAGIKIRYAPEDPGAAPAEDETLPLDYAEIRAMVQRARKMGLMWEVKQEAVKKMPKMLRSEPRNKNPKIWGKATCIACGKEFDKLSNVSFFCQPCKWDPRPCKVCGTPFSPKSAPKRNVVIQTCSKTCAVECMRRQRFGKPPANKGRKKHG